MQKPKHTNNLPQELEKNNLSVTDLAFDCDTSIPNANKTNHKINHHKMKTIKQLQQDIDLLRNIGKRSKSSIVKENSLREIDQLRRKKLGLEIEQILSKPKKRKRFLGIF